VELLNIDRRKEKLSVVPSWKRKVVSGNTFSWLSRSS